MSQLVDQLHRRNAVDDQSRARQSDVQRRIKSRWARVKVAVGGPSVVGKRLQKLGQMHRLVLTVRSAVVAIALVASCAASPSAKSVTAPTVAASTMTSIEAAETAERVRDHDLARNEYLRAIAEAPDSQSEVYARRAFVETLLSWGELPDASKQLIALTVAVPSDPVPWHDLGIVLSVIGTDLEGAEAALTTARDLAPADVRPRIALAALRWRRGNRDGAEEEYRALLTLELTDALRAKVEWALTTLNTSRPMPPP